MIKDDQTFGMQCLLTIKNYLGVAYGVIAKKPNDKSPKVTYTLTGFLLYHISKPSSAATVVFGVHLSAQSR